MTVASSRDARMPAMWRRRGILMPTAALLIALSLAGTWAGNHRGTPTANVEPTSPATSAAAPASAAHAMRRLVDTRAGYRVDYPIGWTELAAGATKGPVPHGHVIRIGGRDAFSVESFRLQHPVSVSNMADMRAVTDAILSSPRAHLTVLDVREVRVAGLPGIYYLYYFPAGRQRGIHAHYFVFDHTRMYSLVFQVVPAGRFASYARQFDQVVASFVPLTH